MPDGLEEERGAVEYESGNVEVQWNIKKCVSDNMSDLVGRVKRRERKPWITQEMIRKRMNKGNERMSTIKKKRTIGDSGTN
jgi:hypothetical protein